MINNKRRVRKITENEMVTLRGTTDHRGNPTIYFLGAERQRWLIGDVDHVTEARKTREKFIEVCDGEGNN